MLAERRGKKYCREDYGQVWVRFHSEVGDALVLTRNGGVEPAPKDKSRLGYALDKAKLREKVQEENRFLKG